MWAGKTSEWNRRLKDDDDGVHGHNGYNDCTGDGYEYGSDVDIGNDGCLGSNGNDIAILILQPCIAISILQRG